MAGDPVVTHSAEASLLEREAEISSLVAALDQASSGTGSIVLVEGPAGIGKTRLLADAVDIASEKGFLVRQARAGEMERDMPFGVVRQLIESLIERATEEERSGWLAGSARNALLALGRDNDTPTAPVTDAYVTINGLYWLLANISMSRPILLVIDDVQWSDPGSLRFLSFIARRLYELPISVILGVRTGEVAQPQEIDALRLEAPILRPQPLSSRGIETLITQRTKQRPSDEFTEACSEATAGNPFLVVELLREVAIEGEGLDTSAARSVSKLAPENVARAILMRLARFGEPSVELAYAIATLGRSPQLRHAAELADLDQEAALEACDLLREAEILAPGLPLEFVHPLVRQAVYREQPEGKRSVAHAKAARILDTAGIPPLDVARHLLLTDPNGEVWVVERLVSAAEATLRAGSNEAAVAFLERALQEPPSDPARVQLLLGIGLVETEPFRAPMVLSAAAEAATETDKRIEALRHLAWSCLSAGDFAGAAKASEDALELLGKGHDDLMLALEGQRYFFAIASAGRTLESDARIEQVAAKATGSTPGGIVARQALGFKRFCDNAPYQEMLDLSLPIPDPPWEVAGGPNPVPFFIAKILSWTGAHDEARRALAAFLEVGYEGGGVISVSVANSFLSDVERHAGRLREAEVHARIAWDIAETVGGFSVAYWSSFLNLAASLLARGALEDFREFVGEFDLSAGPLQVPANPWPLEVRAQLHRMTGDLGAAVDDWTALGEEVEQMRLLNPAYPPWRQEAVEALVLLGRTEEAKGLLAPAKERSESFGAPLCIGTVLRAAAFLEPRKRAIAMFQESVEAIGKDGPPHERARSLLELGAAMRRDGQKADAREVLHEALDLSLRSGAGWIEGRAREELAAAGARPRRDARTGVAALTASELKVATLAAEGFNNRAIAERLFVTRRTVETHLTHIYQKLQISGRDELGGALQES